MRAVVTGGAGFIGSYTVEALRGRGYEVVVVDDLSRGRPENLPAGVQLIEGDVRTPAVIGYVASARPACIVHLAAQVSVPTSIADPTYDRDLNLRASLTLLDVARRVGARFVFASSAAVYGEPSRVPVVETEPLRPLSPYGAAKAGVEMYLAAYGEQYSLPWAALRFANVYGPRQAAEGEGGVVAVFCRALAAGEPLEIHGEGRQTRDFVHARDVGVAVAEAAEASQSGAFNVGTGSETSVRGLAELLVEVAGGGELRQADRRAGDLDRSALDPSRARERLGWAAATPLREGLEETLDWFRSEAAV